MTNDEYYLSNDDRFEFVKEECLALLEQFENISKQNN